MRAVSIITLWLTAVAIVFTLLVFGLVQHYWYFNDTAGLGYDVVKWQGDTLDNSFAYPKDYRYKYGYVRFEKNAEPRVIGIIVVVASVCAGTIFLVSRSRKKS